MRSPGRTLGGARICWPTRGAVKNFPISGRPLQTIVDTQEAGADTVDLAANPRVAYLLIESEQIRWRVTLQEAVRGSPVSGSARD